MTTERTITLCGKQVKMRYCAATEIGFETLTGKSSAIFVPEIIKDKKGNIKEVKQHATLSDFTNLAIAGVVAAYSYPEQQDTPVTATQIMNEATGNEFTTLITTIVELRNEWYTIPEVAKSNDPLPEDDDADDDSEKNS